MMNKARTLIEILEGFKLGSLGVSHKPKITTTSTDEPEPLSSPKVQEPPEEQSGAYETPQKIPGNIARPVWSTGTSDSFFIVGVVWSETKRGFRFQMKCSGTGSAYSIAMKGGRKLSINGRGVASGVDFRGNCEFSASDNNNAEQYFRRLMAEITIAGSFGYALASGELGKGWRIRNFGGLNTFFTYLWNTSRVNKSPYFIEEK
jgi:hypothetical protein